jgi:Pycsar effector protein
MAIPPADDLIRAEAAKAINDQVNYFIQVMDTKASAFLAGGVAAASFLLREAPPGPLGHALYGLAVATYASAVVMAGCVIFPRLPSAGNSVIFWGDVAAHQEFRTYLESFQRIINDGFLDEQYCLQAWFAARVLRRKHRWLRRSIAMFFAALGLSFGLYLWIASTGGGGG